MNKVNSIEVHFALGKQTYQVDIIKVGQEYCRADKKHEELSRWYHSLHFILDGCGTISVNGKKQLLSKGTAFLLFAGEKYDYYPDPIRPWSYIWVDFYESENVNNLLTQCGFTKQKPYVSIKDHMQISNYFVSMFNAYDGGLLQPVNVSGWFTLIIGQYLAEKNKYAPVSVRGSMLYRCFLELVNYIENNYRLNLSVKQIAEDVNLSEYQIYSMFKKFINMTPIDYTNKFRISIACHLFQNMHLNISAASHMVGIEDTKYFSRLFTKYKGISPSDYRNDCEKDKPFAWISELGLD